MTELLQRDGFRERELAEILDGKPGETPVDVEVRWLGAERRATVLIDVKALDRLISSARMHTRSTVDSHRDYGSGHDDGKKAGLDVARREVIGVLNAAKGNPAKIAAVIAWCEG